MSVKPGWNGRFFEDFEVGDIYKHPLGRTVTATDNAWFTNLTLNNRASAFRCELCQPDQLWPAARQFLLHAGAGHRPIGGGCLAECFRQSRLG